MPLSPVVRLVAVLVTVPNPSAIDRQVKERFWARVSTGGIDDCWEWTAGCQTAGYGELRVAGRPELVHRISWQIHFGDIPGGMYVCHHCDNPPCVNPAHLFLGTPKDNAGDMSAKGRHASHTQPHLRRGTRSGSARLTEGDVLSIRERYALGGISQRALAVVYGVSEPTIHAVVNRRNWGWL